MRKLTNSLTALTFMSLTLILASCGDDDETKATSKPLITASQSSLSLVQGETKSVDITISAAGKISDIAASTDKGTVEVTDIIGINQATGSAKINYTAPFELGDATITVTVVDKNDQEISTVITIDVTEHPPIDVTGDVEGEWGPFLTYHVTGNLFIQAGKSLKVLEGTTVIVDGPYSVTVRGNFYSYGTAEDDVLFSVPESKRTKDNIFAGLWGGILASNATTTEMAVIHTRIEYVGLPGVAGTDIVDTGEVDEGDPTYALYFNNPDGKIVVMNSTFAYSTDVAVQINQGSLLVANNTFILNGETGGESVNLKSAAVGDIAFNTFYSAATNGVKWSNSGDRTPQNNANVYNNTAINCGWRQTKAGRGGSFNLEKAGRGKVYNNIVVNSRYGVKFPNAPDNPDIANSAAGYNLYYGITDNAVAGFYPLTGSITAINFESSHNVAGAKGENDPKFVNFNVTTFDEAAAMNSANVDFPAAFDLSLQAGSPALAKGKTDFTTNFTTFTLDGKTYTVPAPASYIGAFGN